MKQFMMQLMDTMPETALNYIFSVYNRLDPVWWWVLLAFFVALFVMAVIRRRRKPVDTEKIQPEPSADIRLEKGVKEPDNKTGIPVEKETEKDKAPEKQPEPSAAKSTEIDDAVKEKAEPPAPVAESKKEAVIPKAPDEAAGFFARLKNGLSRTRDTFSNGFEKIFSANRKIDDELLEEMEELLITSDIGVQTTMDIMARVSKKISGISDARQLKDILKEEILSFFQSRPAVAKTSSEKPYIIMVIGVNGVGKTTTIGKLAQRFSRGGKQVLIAAADTFRAAAIEQLSIWADRAGAEIVKHRENSDPSAVVYDSMEAAVARQSDIVLVDTAGRLHTRANLMEELKKIKRTIAKKIPGAPHETLLVLDATTGQNALSQAKLFHADIDVTGIALTKLDGTAKGGIVISICDTLNIPLKYIGVGEQAEDLQDFNAEQFVKALF